MRSAEWIRVRALAVLGVTYLWACGGDGDGDGPMAPPGTVVTVEVAPSADTLTALGATRLFSAVARDAGGATVPGQTFTWTSSADGVATVDATGLVTAVGNGVVTITASAAGVSGSASLTVSQEVSTVEVTPVTETATAVGATVLFSAVARDAGGSAIGGVSFLWVSSDQSVATVDTAGLATATGAGETTITAAARGVPGHAVLTVMPPAFVSMSAGEFHTCGVTTGDAAYCWGANNTGQLGDGTTTERSVPVPVSGALSFASLSAGRFHTCGVTTGGAAYCWGDNDFFQMGDGTTTQRLTPVAVLGGLSFASLSAGNQHTCGVTTGGDAHCWGRNNAGQLGDGSTTDRSAPVAVEGGLSFAVLSGGAFHTCGLTTGDAVYCWGDNFEGQLGDGTTDQRLTPVATDVSNTTFSSLSAGEFHTSAVAIEDDRAYTWGRNAEGQLGIGTTDNWLSPGGIAGGLTFTSVAAGARHTCGVRTSGGAYCWGDNGAGQLGDGTTTQSLTAVAVLGGLSFGSLSSGSAHTCGVTGGGAAYCWGFNSSGQLGDGTTAYSFVPVRVALPVSP